MVREIRWFITVTCLKDHGSLDKDVVIEQEPHENLRKYLEQMLNRA